MIKDIKMRGFNPPIYIDLTFNSYRSVIHMKIDLFRQYFLIGNKLNISHVFSFIFAAGGKSVFGK